MKIVSARWVNVKQKSKFYKKSSPQAACLRRGKKVRLYRRFSAGGQGGDLFILLRQDALEFLAGDVFLFQQVFGP